jgi:hypothetical protein
MFDVMCDHLGHRVLRHMSDVTGIENEQGSIRMFYSCWCGVPGVLTTGRGVTSAHSGHIAG